MMTSVTPGRTEVLLRAGVDQPELRDVDRTAEDVRRGVGHERHGARLRDVVPLGAVDGVVRRDVRVGRVRVERQLAGLRHPREALRLGGSGDADRPDLLRLLHRLLRPDAGDDVVGRAAGGSRFIGTIENWRLAPPCRNST
jgi:hypothetical protein